VKRPCLGSSRSPRPLATAESDAHRGSGAVTTRRRTGNSGTSFHAVDRGMQGFARTAARLSGWVRLPPNPMVMSLAFPVHRRATARAENVSSRRCPRGYARGERCEQNVSAGECTLVHRAVARIVISVVPPRRRKVGAFVLRRAETRQACRNGPPLSSCERPRSHRMHVVVHVHWQLPHSRLGRSPSSHTRR